MIWSFWNALVQAGWKFRGEVMKAIKDVDFGNNVIEIVSNDYCQIYQIRNETGEGQITMYEVFKGVYLTYNDFHMKRCKSEWTSNTNVLCIDHCREGKIEELAPNGRYRYLSAGDLRIDNRSGHDTDFTFPFSHYHGLSILFKIDDANTALKENFLGFPVDLQRLKEKYCSFTSQFIIRSVESIEHIFSELYTVPHKIKKYYYKIKIYEMLLFLDALEISDYKDERPYFYKTEVEKIKEIHEVITSRLDRHFTLKELSKRFDISLTSMKKCFKGVYGLSIYAYTKVCRMNQAATLLKTTKTNIADIAASVGYSSPSKFSAAFKNVLGYTPKEYRNLRGG